MNTPDTVDHPPRPMVQRHIQINREAGYTIGFFMFWLATASSSLFSWILLRPASRFNKPLSKGP